MVRSLLGIHNVFLLHGSLLVLSVIFSAVFLPETRNKSIRQLESMNSQGQKEQNKQIKL